MKIRAVTIYWNDEADETKLDWNPDFNNLYPIARYDIIKDAIFMLKERLKKEEE